jgi:CheY-like chemotaxis protein
MYNLLICDDERDIRNALKIYLSGEGYKIFEAENGEEALSIASSEEIHLILMDIMMPKMDGVSATVKLRESCNAPVIFLTAKSEDTDKILGLTAGADDYITKPFNPLEVIARIKAQLRRYAYFGGMEKKEDTLSVGGLDSGDKYAFNRFAIFNGGCLEGIEKRVETNILNVYVVHGVILPVVIGDVSAAPRHYNAIDGEFVTLLQRDLTVDVKGEAKSHILIHYNEISVYLFAAHNKF